jgi:hypothetical protein
MSGMCCPRRLKFRPWRSCRGPKSRALVWRRDHVNIELSGTVNLQALQSMWIAAEGRLAVLLAAGEDPSRPPQG